jgi:hypothetical protein
MEHFFSQKNEESAYRHGFHYFQDSLHYRSDDLQLWLPILKSLGAAWLVLQGEAVRAIPEEFIRGLFQDKIEPIIHFPLDLSNPVPIEQMEPMLSAYAKWGVRHVIFFDRPNLQTAWGNSRWSQENLMAAFIDQYLPLAEAAVRYGLNPIFPPLEPGGQYWDTVFLQQALEEMQKRRADLVLARLGISAYAWSGNKSLNWGLGGMERWPKVKAYRIPADSQDQRGFRIYDWYQSVARKVLHKNCPIILLQTGLSKGPDSPTSIGVTESTGKDTYLNIIRLLKNENVYEGTTDPSALASIPADVVCGNFWLLSNAVGNGSPEHAWLDENGQKSELAEFVSQWIQSGQKNPLVKEWGMPVEKNNNEPFTISRYLFFPSLEYFMENEHREEIQEYLQRHQPTIGFSLKEAAHAAVVDIGADEENLPDGVLDALRQCGCAVRRLFELQPKEVNEDYGEELGDYPSEKNYDYAEV